MSTATSNRDGLIDTALTIWAPDYPRRATRRQTWVQNRPETREALLASESRDEDSPFVSVYSFPDGHTKDGNIPSVDTLFIDFDIEDGDYERGSGDREAWRRDLSHLLVRARQVAQYISDNGSVQSWRAALSGHKGIHLFVDFPALNAGLGSFEQYVGGLNDYANDLVSEIASETGLRDLDDYVDVTSSDLGRLCRVPNTLHCGASASFGEERYCVPVSIDELTNMTAERYEELTTEPREIPWESRFPDQEIGNVVQQYVVGHSGSTKHAVGTGSSVVDWSRVEEYRDQSNDDLTLDDVRLLTSDMPCVWEWYKRDDKYRHGVESHHMENHCIAKLVRSGFPIEVIKEFLNSAEEYDETYSERQIEKLIAWDFNPYTTEKLLQRAPTFCGYDFCSRCQRVIAENDDLQRIHNT